MRLLTVGPLPPEWGGKTGGGVATTHRLLLGEFARRNDLSVHAALAPNHDPEGRRKAPDWVPLVTVPANSRDQRSLYADLVRDCDAVLLLHIKHRWAVWHARHHAKVPAVGSIRSWHAITHPTGDPQRARRALDEALTGLAALVFPSRHTRAEGSELGFTYSCPAHVVLNPVRPEFLEPRLGPRRGLVFVGSLIPRKRADLAVRAASQAGRACTVIGDGPEEGRLRALAKGLDVRFLGRQPPERVAEEVARAEALCVPSESEGLGNVYLEAAACGTPAVGFGPSLDEVRDRLGMDVGVAVRHPTDAAVTDAVRAVLRRAWDHHGLRDRARRRLQPESAGEGYVAVLRSAQRARRGATRR